MLLGTDDISIFDKELILFYLKRDGKSSMHQLYRKYFFCTQVYSLTNFIVPYYSLFQN